MTQSQPAVSHAHSAHMCKAFSADTVVSFVQAIQSLTSTEVGKACIAPETMADVMQEIKRNAEEIIAQSDRNKIKIKSEFGGDDAPGQQHVAMDFDPAQFLAHPAEMKSKGGGSSGAGGGNSLNPFFSFDHELRLKSLEQQPMSLVMQPHGGAKHGGHKGASSSAASSSGPQEIVFPNNSLHSMALDHNIFAATSLATAAGKSPAKKPKERPHVCLVCHMTFSQKNHLQVHERKHTGERPYKCVMCDAAFARKDGLVIHQRKHTGERPYKCTFCDSAFTRKDKMVIHERTHTGEKPYACMQCESKYTRKDKLTLHMRKHALAARRELEKVLQSTSAVVNNLTLQSAAAAAGIAPPHSADSVDGGGGSSGPETAVNLRIPDPTAASLSLQAAANMTLANTTAVSTPGTPSMDSMQLSSPSTAGGGGGGMGHLGIPNSLAASLSLPSPSNSSLIGNLTFQNAMAAANLSFPAPSSAPPLDGGSGGGGGAMSASPDVVTTNGLNRQLSSSVTSNMTSSEGSSGHGNLNVGR